MNVLMLKPWVVNERLDLQCNEVKLQILLLKPFVLMDTAFGLRGASTFGGVNYIENDISFHFWNHTKF